MAIDGGEFERSEIHRRVAGRLPAVRLASAVLSGIFANLIESPSMAGTRRRSFPVLHISFADFADFYHHLKLNLVSFVPIQTC